MSLLRRSIFIWGHFCCLGEMQEKQEKPASAPVGHGRENRIICPYLDTVDRSVLDFDFEKVCSVTLSNVNVYACLVCGKYFQGRGQHTPAFEHSLEVEHHVFMHLETLKAWCLPEGYEIIDASLDDIKHVIRPLLAPEYIATLDRVSRPSRTLDGTTYLPGFVGLNNIGHTDYINAVVHALSRVTPLRNHLLLEANTEGFSPLVSRFGDLLRRMWNPSNFRPQVSPHELVQLVDVLSKRHFHIGTPGDPTEFMAWFLHCLRTDLRHPPVTARPAPGKATPGAAGGEAAGVKHGRSGAPVAKRGKRSFLDPTAPPAQITIYTLKSQFISPQAHRNL
ncbi:putative Spindle pole body protein - Sad1p [Paratrimastix pyriformis]|uniref:Spindle pole body protein - Sad1p n=1 Tax=Paratrimastix pyriformis TaxID=342808 RepID=A0ABQ8UN08_9EUKA|nr:putative Spindle pole body protein - Sad1p [Paratrimastix pyriformis]